MSKDPSPNGGDKPEPEDEEMMRQEQQQPNTLAADELQRLNKELAEWKDKYLRALAENENARKRMMKEREENSQHAMASVISEFLKPMDNMENALRFADRMSQDVKNWATGFHMILEQFKDILSAHGVTPMAAEGKAFDPHFHEAIETVETEEHRPGTIVEECTRGYKMGNRTIRPARVKVAKAVKVEEKPRQDDEQLDDEIDLNQDS